MLVTAAVRIKHGDLRQAANLLGSQTALAKHLGVSVGAMTDWCNLRKCPPTEEMLRSNPGRYYPWTIQRLAELEKKLFDLTGKVLDDLFPPELRRVCGSIQTKIEQTKEVGTFFLAQHSAQRLVLPSPITQVEQRELREILIQMVDSLPPRLKDMVEMRYGLKDGIEKTLDEVAEANAISRERARQLLAFAVRKLQQPQQCRGLADFVQT